MLERFLQRVLNEGLQNMAQNTEDLRVFLRSQNRLGDAEEDKLVSVFTETPFEVYQDLARAWQRFPNVCIVLGPESEMDNRGVFLGDIGGVVSAEEAALLEAPSAAGAGYSTSIYQRAYHLYVHALHPDVCIVGYEIVKRLLALARPALNEAGVMNTKISGQGIEPIPRQEAGADHIFRRIVKFDAIEPFEVVELEPLASFSSIAGLHIDGGSTSDVGNVTTLVEPKGAFE